MIIHEHGLFRLITSNQSWVLTTEFYLSLVYLWGIKQKISTAIDAQTVGETEKQNSTMKTCLKAFVHYKQNDRAKFSLMAQFAYNHAKNLSIGYIFFEFNCEFDPWAFYKEDLGPWYKWRASDDWAT